MRQTILILAANPKDTKPLRLDEEVREIKAGLERAKQRDQFVLEHSGAVRPRDIQRAMLDLNPQIIHFSGHGTRDEGLVFEDETGSAKLVDGEALAKLFQLFADKVKCVVLNGCYSEAQAEAIAQHINYVIGMKKAIGDKAAIEFAVGFYDALGNGKSVAFAYDFGCAAIGLAGLTEQLTPILKKRPNGEELSPSSKEDTPEPDKPKQTSLKEETARLLKALLQMQGPINEGKDGDRGYSFGIGDTYESTTWPKEVQIIPTSELEGVIRAPYDCMVRHKHYIGKAETATKDNQHPAIVTARYSIDHNRIVHISGIDFEGHQARRCGNSIRARLEDINGKKLN